jgi:hypothetical protein
MRRAAILVASAALMVAAPGASADPITFPADPGFSAGSAWTASSTCALLCTATGTQPASGGNPGGQALASYSTVVTVLGLATGSVDFTSSAFSWIGDSPASASLHVDTQTSLGSLLSLGGSANATIGLTDVTAAHTTTLKSLTFPAGQAWTGTDVPATGTLLVDGHSYKLTIHTTFSATLALLGSATVAYDNVSLTAVPVVPADPPVDPPADPPVDPPADPPVHTPVDPPTQTTGHGGGATTTTTTTTTATTTPAAMAAPTNELIATAAGAPACRTVRILARTSGIRVQVENFVTTGAPLTITPQRQAKSIKKVTVDGKAVAATVKGRKVSLGARQLKVGHHVIRVGTGAHAARLGVAIASCRSSAARP